MKSNRGLEKWNEGRSFIPCSITLCNALCGLSAVIYMMGYNPAETTIPTRAIWLILAAIFFDIFDGFVARKLNAESQHGMELDSLADMLTFGMAPAILIFRVGMGWWDNTLSGQWIPWFAAGFYVVCTMWRLATYNTIALSGTSTKKRFSGLPSPASALMLCSMLLFLEQIDAEPRIIALSAVIYAFVLGSLMVSRVEYMHGKGVLKIGTPPIRIIAIALIITGCISYGAMVVFLVVHLYLFTSYLETVPALKRFMGQEPEEADAPVS